MTSTSAVHAMEKQEESHKHVSSKFQGKRQRVPTPTPTPAEASQRPQSSISGNTSKKTDSSSPADGFASHQSKRVRAGLPLKAGKDGSSRSTPTLHACSLNTPQRTVKELYVDEQQRFLVEKRISKIQNKIAVVVTYQIKPETENDSTKDKIFKLQLKDMWAEVDWMSSGTLINIVGVPIDESGCFVVERLNGYLIVEPDRLMTATSVVTQLYCERKAALSRFICGGGDNAVTYRGVVAHELICKAMTDRLDKISVLRKEAKNICNRPQMLERAYGVGLTDEDLDKLQTSVAEWVSRFMISRFFGPSNKKSNSEPSFSFMDVLGVEDNIWNPIYGLKGKIDATVLIRKDNQVKTTPLEFKTGSIKSQKRETIKADHVGQVSLYTLMMATKFGPVEEAMLYYISDDSLSFHPPRALELQQLIMKRNKLIRSITLTDGDLPYLPRPDGIDYDFKCKTCEVRNICTLQLRKNNIPTNEQTKTEKALLANCKLSDEELYFFEQWWTVINAETEEVEKRYNDKTLWTIPPEVREDTGNCITNLKLVGDSVPWVDASGKPSFLVSFERKGNSSSQFLASLLKLNDLVVLSSNVEVCIDYGVIVARRDNEITLSFDQALHKEYKTCNFTYSLDKINTTSPIASQYGYLMKLMEDSPEAERLRQYIINKKQPKYGKLQMPDPQLQEIVRDLNAEQMRVIWKSQVTDSFLFVKGTPGSGKTASIVRLLRALVHTQKTVLVVSYTGTALDHILKKFQEYNDKFIKVSNSSSVTEASLRLHTTKELSKTANSLSELNELYNKPVVGTTLLSLKHPIFQVRRFDYCIIDEASQALPTAVFGVLGLCDKYIVFGDPNQLPPVIQSSIVKNLKICDNFFSLMASPVSTIKLNTQYRMNRGVTQLANALIYENQMKCANKELEKRYLKLTSADIEAVLKNEVKNSATRNLLCHVISKRREKAAVFVDTSDITALESKVEESVCNKAEAYLTMCFVHLFVRSGLNPSSLGIVAPFRAQVDLLRKVFKNICGGLFREVEVNTVDQYQGREKEVIFCTFTKSLPKGSPFFCGVPGETKEGILEDIRRLNVAITRARSKVVMLGNRHTLKEYTPFKKLFEILKEEQTRKLTRQEFDGLQLYANSIKAEDSADNPMSHEPSK